MRRLAAVAVAVAAAALGTLTAPGPAAAVEGDVRLLVILATWGPQPVSEESARAAVVEAEAYVAAASFGRVRLTGRVTPWLHAYAAPVASCDLTALEANARAAAAAAGWTVAAFDQLAFVLPRVHGCPWSGAYFGNHVWANGRFDRQLLAHELGHVWGVTEEGPAWVCEGARCAVRNYASPYSVMGHGFADYNAYEKAAYRWLDPVTPRRTARYELAPIDRPSSLPRALRVLTAGDEYWLEYRPPAPTWPAGVPGATPGLVIHAGDNGLGLRPRRFPQRNLLLADPARRGRPSVQAGETFVVTGAFSVAVERLGAESLELSFRFIDRTPPRPPPVDVPRTARRTVVVRWRAAFDSGSGVERYEVRVDGRVRRVLRAVTRAGPFLAATELRAALRVPAPGRHTVSVTPVDRAGNRGRPGIGRVRVVR